MAAHHVLRIDSLIESLTLCNAGDGFLFQLDTSSEIIVQPEDLILGLLSPINEIKYIFSVESASGNSLLLKKRFESSDGVEFDFSVLPELQPNAYEKELFTIDENLFNSLASRLFKFSKRGSIATKSKYTGPTVQKILYGCPGTGKSREVKKLTEGIHGENTIHFEDGTTNVFRTTFHPDYDYSTFVGCYKPVKIDNVLDYKFIPQVFTNAYVAAKKHPDTPIYLIIEEINRGNCAQIFGDLFQLLDRKDGVSEFPINAEEELKRYLRDEAELEDYTMIELPANFNIYATMNTSDQSLFPMDSAFKRRWEMKYVKIDYKKDAANFIFTVNGKDYHWLDYLPCFNDKITDASDSEDKQMGEFFIRENMTAEDFKNKVMFYLWNDVCKDLYAGSNSPQSFFFRDIYGKPFRFTQLFNEPGPDASDDDKKDPYKNGDLLLEGFLYYVMNGKKKAPKPATETPAAEETENESEGTENE